MSKLIPIGLGVIGAITVMQVYIVAADPTPFRFACLAVDLLAFAVVLVAWMKR